MPNLEQVSLNLSQRAQFGVWKCPFPHVSSVYCSMEAPDHFQAELEAQILWAVVSVSGCPRIGA